VTPTAIKTAPIAMKARCPELPIATKTAPMVMKAAPGTRPLAEPLLGWSFMRRTSQSSTASAAKRSESAATAGSDGIRFSSGTLPGIEKDRPFDDLGFDENTAAGPGILTKQLRRLGSGAGLDDEENPTVVGVRPSQDNPPLFEEAVHEHRVLVPERLLTTR